MRCIVDEIDEAFFDALTLYDRLLLWAARVTNGKTPLPLLPFNQKGLSGAGQPKTDIDDDGA